MKGKSAYDAAQEYVTRQQPPHAAVVDFERWILAIRVEREVEREGTFVAFCVLASLAMTTLLVLSFIAGKLLGVVVMGAGLVLLVPNTIYFGLKWRRLKARRDTLLAAIEETRGNENKERRTLQQGLRGPHRATRRA